MSELNNQTPLQGSDDNPQPQAGVTPQPAPQAFSQAPGAPSATNYVPGAPTAGMPAAGVPVSAAVPAAGASASAAASAVGASINGAPAPGMPYPDPRDQVPETLRPGKHHVHHTYVWLGGLRAAFVALAAIGVSVFGNVVGSMADEEGGIDLLFAIMPFVIGGALLLILLIVGLIFLVQWLSWKNLTYELGTDEFTLNSGIISKKRMHVPYQRVQAVNQNAGLIQRIVGVCDVKIDTAGGATNDGVRLTYMRTSEAEALRAELFRRKKVLLAGGSVAEDGTAQVNGSLYYSAWAIACMGGTPQATPLTAFGYVLQPAPGAPIAQGAAAGYAGAAGMQAPGLSPDETNVLDVADEVLRDVRGVFGGNEVDTGQVQYETGLSNKELLLAGASGAGEGLGLLFVGIVAAVGSVAQLFQGAIERWTEDWVTSIVVGGEASIVLPDANTASSLIGGAALQIILWALLAIAALWVISALGTVVRYGGFRLRRREGRVEVESGLLSRSFHGVDVDRVQSVVVKQSFIRRLMGYCELSVHKIDSATTDSTEAQGQQPATKGVVIHPFVKMSRVPEIIAGVLPEFADMPTETFKPAPVAKRRAIVRMGIIRSAAFWFAVFVALCQAAMELVIVTMPLNAEELAMLATVRYLMFAYYAIFVLAFVVNVVNAILWHKRSGLGYDRGFMSMTNGGLAVTTTYTPRKKIQFAYLRTNPFQRMAHVASVNVRTAAGVGGTTETLWDLPEEDADAWMEWVRPRGKRAQAAESNGEAMA